MAIENRIDNPFIGAAGVHFVVSELSRRGLIALPTIRNTAAYDVIVATKNGKKHANIQVKTSQKKVGSFPMPPSEKIRSGPKDWYVLVRWLEEVRKFEGFMVSGKQAKKLVQREERNQGKSEQRNKLWPCLRLDRWNDRCSGTWRRRWERWGASRLNT